MTFPLDSQVFWIILAGFLGLLQRRLQARDHLGVIPGPIDPGTCWCGGNLSFPIHPEPPPVELEEAKESALKRLYALIDEEVANANL